MNWNHIALDFYLVIVARYILIVNLSRIHLLKRVSVSAQAWRFKPMIKQAPFSFNIPRNPWDQLICRRPRISQNTTFRKTGLVKLWLTFDSLQEATTILEWVHTKTEYIIWIINTLSSYLTRSHLPGSECTPRACHPWARPRPGSVCRWQASEWISCFLPRSGSGLYLCRCPTYVPPTRCRERVSDREWKWSKMIELQHFTYFKFKHRKNCKWCPLSFVIVLLSELEGPNVPVFTNVPKFSIF